MSENQSLNFKRLVEAHCDSLYRFAYSLTGSEPKASDLTHKSFYIYANKGDSACEPSKTKSWLFTTLYGEFLRLHATAQSEKKSAPALQEEAAPAVAPAIVTVLDGLRAMTALKEIAEAIRTPLVLFYLKELTYKEIAELTGAPIETVMSRVALGKILLKKTLLERSRRS